MDIVSIVVPVYNVEKYLKRCIESLIKQTYSNVEILLINDGSLDNSEDICLYYKKQDNRIEYFKKNNGGLSSARNYGIDKAKGKYIYFIDSDDYCEYTLIEDLLKCINMGNQIVACDYCIEYTNNNFVINKRISNDNCENIKHFITRLNEIRMFNVVWNKMYVLDIIKKNNLYFDETAMPGEDLLFNCSYLEYVQNAGFVNRIEYHYMREDEVTLVNKYDSKLIDKIEKFIRAKKKLYTNLNLNNEENIRDINDTIIDYTFSCIPNLFRKDCRLTKPQKQQEIVKIFNISKKDGAYKNISKKDIHRYIFIKNICLNKPKITYYFYKLLFILRNNCSSLYRIIRKKLFIINKINVKKGGFL